MGHLRMKLIAVRMILGLRLRDNADQHSHQHESCVAQASADGVHRKTVHSNSPFWLRIVGGFTGLIYPSVTTHTRLDMSPFRRARRTWFRAFCVLWLLPAPSFRASVVLGSLFVAFLFHGCTGLRTTERFAATVDNGNGKGLSRSGFRRPMRPMCSATCMLRHPLAKAFKPDFNLRQSRFLCANLSKSLL